jgi:phosphatidylglycerol lysyltransferase
LKKKWLQLFTWIFILLIFTLACYSIYRELHAYKLKDILHEIRQVPLGKILLALVATFLSYTALTGYDVLGVKYAGKKLPYRQIAVTSYTSYFFSYNIGLSALSGSAVRYRFYTAQGLSAVEIMKVLGFCLLTFWIGLIASASFFMVFTPVQIPQLAHLPFGSTRPLGILFMSILALYLLLVMFRRKPLIIKGAEFNLPSAALVPLQLFYSLIDWVMAGLALYILLPQSLHISFPEFLGLFILAQALSVLSSVPGGVGIFESLILLFLSGKGETSQLFSSLFLYRLVYYLIPLASGMLGFLGHEIVREKEKTTRILGSLGRWMSGYFPVILSIMTFIGGGILIFSGTTPALPGRMEWIRDVVPLPLVEASHFLGSLSGLILMILALGLLNRTRASYFMTLAFFLAGSLFSLLKGLDFEEAAVLFLFFLLLLPYKKFFYRKARITADSLTLSWFVLVSIVLVSSVYLGFFSYRHVEYSHALWWKFTVRSDASRFLRASLGVVMTLLTASVYILFRTGTSHPGQTDQEGKNHIAEMIEAWGGSEASLAYLPDKYFLYYPPAVEPVKPSGFLMYGVSGKTWIAMGDPVGPDEVVRELIWKFRQETHHFDSRALFYEITPRYLPYYIELGFSLLKIGEDAIVNLEKFTMLGHDRSSMRNTLNRLNREGLTFEVLEKDQTESVLSELKTISDDWLEDKNAREKGFSLGYFNETYLCRFRTALIRDSSGKILAFSNLWESPGQKQVSIDLMRYTRNTPPGLMDYLFIRLIQWAQESGYKTFDLGMAPFSGLPDKTLAPLWNRLGSTLFKHGENFYNFQGLRQYKDKFDPHWEPRYIALQGGLTVPRTLLDLTSLINGSLMKAVKK